MSFLPVLLSRVRAAIYIHVWKALIFGMKVGLSIIFADAGKANRVMELSEMHLVLIVSQFCDMLNPMGITTTRTRC